MQIYGADQIDLSYPYGDSTPLSRPRLAGTARLQPAASATASASAAVRAAGAYRYYLVWLTTLPPGKQSASISELTLFK